MGDATQAAAYELRHAAMPYRSADEFAAGVTSFLQSGRRGGNVALVACPKAHLGLLRERLNGQADRVTWADISGVGLNPARLISAIREFADQHPGGTAWCVQESAWPARSPAELREVIRHEALLNLALADAPARVLCPYDVRLGAELIGAAEGTHPMVIRGGRWQASRSYAADKPIPAGWDGPLSPVPPDAHVLPYRDDIAGVRDATAEQARRAGLQPDRVTDLVIAVAEIAANTLGHAGGPGVLRTWVADGEIVCQLNDSGMITDPLAGMLRPRPAAAGGYGLWLVNQACDLVELRTGPAGTEVRLHMRLDSRPA